MSIKTRLIAGASTLAIAGGMMAAVAPAANAATTLLSCTGIVGIGTANPTLKSGNAAYTKVALKDSDGTKTDVLSGAIPADATTCSVDAGIRTNQGGQDIKYTLDDQTNGAASLTTSGPIAKGGTTTVGSTTCNSADPALTTTFPTAYPLQGKLQYKFDQLDALAHNIQLQAYVRTGVDPLDPTFGHITVKGIVIKGPGVGGDVKAVFAFGATTSVKNVNLLDCVANPSATTLANPAGVASLAELDLTQADGSDAGTGVDPLTVSLP